MLRTFKIYAADNFLGYEYAEDEAEAQIKTYKKFGAPKNWGIEAYNAKLIKWAEELV